MSDDQQRFRVIQGGPAEDGKAKPKPYRARKQTEAEQITCRICEADIGVASSLGLEVKQSPMWKNNRVTGGTKTLICVHCLARGLVTKLTV